MINEARAEYNRVIPRASGEAQQAILEAEGYGLNRVNRAEGESARFRSIQEAYRRAPEVTRRRLYYETMERVLPQVGKVFVDEDAQGIVPLLPLDGLRNAMQQGVPGPGGAPAAAAGGGR